MTQLSETNRTSTDIQKVLANLHITDISQEEFTETDVKEIQFDNSNLRIEYKDEGFIYFDFRTDEKGHLTGINEITSKLKNDNGIELLDPRSGKVRKTIEGFGSEEIIITCEDYFLDQENYGFLHISNLIRVCILLFRQRK